jgi:hypothetical protein
MWFAVVHHTEVVVRLSVLWAAVSLAAQPILSRLPVDASQVGIVGEIFARLEERGEWCSRLETSGSMVCDIILGPVDGRVHLITHLEEAAR